MSLRAVVAAVIVALASPALAESMTPVQARNFVVGQQFAFACFDGSAGQGRIFNDGSVTGRIRLQGHGPERYINLPHDTLRVRGEAVCALLPGASFEPCFDLNKTSARSFRGTLAGVPGLWCEFVSGGQSGVASIRRRTTVASDAAN